ncbi:hypothetical protein BDV19DRAFT_387277 [Aspergillus venezuelensis]
MKLSLVALSSVLALVAAQDSTSTSDAPATTHSLTPTERCILNCDDTDICCIAACNEVPCPSDQQANDTNTCAAQCDQGSGSEADTQAYAECQARCITTTFFPGTATLTNSPTSTSSSDSSATTTSASDDDSSDDSSSDSSDSSSTDDSSSSDSPSSTSSDDASSTDSADDEAPTDNAAMRLGASAAGLAGLFVAALVL